MLPTNEEYITINLNDRLTSSNGGSFKVKLSGSEQAESEFSNTVTVWKTQITITHGTATSMPYVFQGTEVQTITITPDTSGTPAYTVPSTVTINGVTGVSGSVGATWTYNNVTGVITLVDITQKLVVSAVCIESAYPVTYSISNGTTTGGSSIVAGGTLSGTITPDSNYTYPSSITVTNATLDSYNSSTGAWTISNPTGAITITASCIRTYNITYSITNGTTTGSSLIVAGGTVSGVITPSATFELPSTISVSGATLDSYNQSTGAWTISNPTADIIVAALCTKIIYNVTYNITFGTSTGASTIEAGGTVSGVATPDSTYMPPSALTVTNATLSSYNSATGDFTISNPTGAVTVNGICRKITMSIVGNITNGSLSGATEIEMEGTATVNVVPISGYYYPANITVENATLNSYNDTTGVCVISNPTGVVTITATCLIQLTAPVATLSGNYAYYTHDSATTTIDIYEGNTLVASIPITE